MNGGINHPANPSEFTIESNRIIFESPAKTGANFVGWFSDNTLTTNISEIPQGSTGDKTVFAKWELDIYNIRYVLNGGVNHPANPPGYTIESGQIVFGPASKIGANFMGWYNDKEFTDEIAGIPPLSTGDTTIFAKWELDTFKIQYVLNGGNNHPKNPVEYTIESDSVLFENPDKNGFFFDGWYTTSTYTEKITSIPTGHSGDITVYAKWQEIFTVSFIITTDSINPAKDVDIVINELQKMRSDDSGKADILVNDGSHLSYSIQINGIVIENGQITVAGKDETITIKIVDCNQRWYDVLFCDNGKGLWSSFAWYKDGVKLSGEQFFHCPGGIDNGQYLLKLISVAGVEYTWENILIKNNQWKNLKDVENIQMTVFPNPVGRGGNLFISLSENTNLQASIILIYNSSGAIITKIINPSFMNSIELNERFSSGLYHVVLTDDDMSRKSTKSFIVN